MATDKDLGVHVYSVYIRYVCCGRGSGEQWVVVLCQAVSSIWVSEYLGFLAEPSEVTMAKVIVHLL